KDLIADSVFGHSDDRVFRHDSISWTYEFEMFLLQTQLLGHDILCASRDYQRLRHRSQRRERKVISAPVQSAMGEIDLDTVARDNCLFFGSDIGRELLAKLGHERGDLNAEKSIVVCIAQVGLRKTGCGDQWNALRF